MTVATFTNDWISRIARVMLMGETAPSPNEFYLALAGTTLSRASSYADCLAAELPTANGYDRFPLNFAAGAYNVTGNRFEVPIINATWTATGNGFQFQSAFLIAGGMVAAIINESSPVAVAPGQTHSYKIPIVTLNTGYANGI